MSSRLKFTGNTDITKTVKKEMKDGGASTSVVFIPLVRFEFIKILIHDFIVIKIKIRG